MWGVIILCGFVVGIYVLSKVLEPPVDADGKKKKRRRFTRQDQRHPVLPLVSDSLPGIDVPVISDFDAQRDIVAIAVNPPDNPNKRADVLLDALEIVETEGEARIFWRGEVAVIVEKASDLVVALQPNEARPLFFDREGKRIAQNKVDVVLTLRKTAQKEVAEAL